MGQQARKEHANQAKAKRKLAREAQKPLQPDSIEDSESLDHTNPTPHVVKDAETSQPPVYMSLHSRPAPCPTYKGAPKTATPHPANLSNKIVVSTF
jgi:hypothetical protein